MSQIKLDLSKLKHVSSDKDMTTLRHPDGHTVSIYHKALSKPAQAQLAQLAKLSPQAETPDQAAQSNQQKMADGGVPAAQPAPKPEEPKKELKPYLPPKSTTKYEDKPNKGHGGIKHLAEGGEAHECEGKKFCMHCGGAMPRGMYPDGGEVTPLADDQTQSQGTPPIPSMAPQPVRSENPDIQPPKQKNTPATDPNDVKHAQMYNQMVDSLTTGGGSGGGLLSFAELPTSPHFNEDAKFKITPEGIIPPVKFNPEAGKMATAKFQQSNQDAQLNAQKAAAKQNEDAAVAAGYGIKLPTATPDATQVADAQGQTGPAWTPPPGQGVQQGLSPDLMMQATQAGYEKGFGLQEQGANETAKALQQQAIDSQEIHNRAAKANTDSRDELQRTTQESDKDFNEAMQDYAKGMISPDKYWQGDPQTGDGGHSKVLAGIGMILAGFNPTSNPNAAINMLKYQIDKSLEAQANNQTSRGNILQANMAHYRDKKSAVEASRLMMLDGLQHEIQAAAAKSSGGQAAGARDALLGQIQNQRAQMGMQFNMRRAIMNLTSSPNAAPGAVGQTLNYLEASQSPDAKELRARYVPSLDVIADKPMDSGVMTKLEGQQKLDAGLKDLQQFVKTHSTILNAEKLDPDAAQQAIKVKKLQTDIREGLLGTVYREGEQPLLDSFVNSNPAGILKNFTSNKQIQELINGNKRDIGVTMKQYGIRPRLGIQQGQQQNGQSYQPKSFKPAGQ